MEIDKKYFLGYRRLSILLAAVFLLGGLGGWLLHRYETQNLIKLFDTIGPLRENSTKYNFINPLLGYKLPESTQFEEYKPLEKKVNDLIQQKIDSKEADSVSVYFRDVARGRWVGINESNKYNPASLLKVPLLIAYLKEAARNPAILNKNLTFTQAMDSSGSIPFEAPSSLKVGSSYTVQDLLSNMIVNSDNGAKDVLLSTVDPDGLAETYTDLGIINPDSVKGDYLISAKTYALFFSTLYSSTYLDREMSEKALQLLSQTTFKDGLVAGIPQGTKNSHKFGEHVIADANGNPTTVELHDCGIIYKDKNPYILCVMTKGSDAKKLAPIIADISRLVYGEVGNE